MPKIDRPADDAPAESWLVYADALQADDDPFGELIVLNHAVERGEDPARRDAHLSRHAERIFGTVAAQRACLEIAWRHQLAETVSVRIGPEDDGEALVQGLLSSPLAPLIRRLRLVGLTPGARPVALERAVARVATDLPPTCTALELVDERARTSRTLVSTTYTPQRNLVSFGPLDAIWALPQLRSLRIDVADAEQLQIGTFEAPPLTSLTILPLRWPFGSEGPGDCTRALAGARWPALKQLVLRLPEVFTYDVPDQGGAYVPIDHYDIEHDYGAGGGYVDTDWPSELGPLLTALQATELEHLSLTGFSTGRGLLETLRASGLPPKLKHLDLSGSDLDSPDVKWMVRNASLFAGLQTLDVRGTRIRDPAPLEALGNGALEVLHTPGKGSVYQFSVGME